MHRLRRVLTNALRAGSFGPGFFFLSLAKDGLPRSLPLWRRVDRRYSRKMMARLKKRLLPEVLPLVPVGSPADALGEDCPLWVFWWQGEENAPEIVRRCVRMIRRNAGAHPVIFLDEGNYRDYVILDPSVEEKREQMGLTHFSDCLRFSLLRQRGGLWIDASMLLCRPFPPELLSAPFYTLRHGLGADWLAGKGRFTLGVMGCTREHPAAVYMEEMLRAYWRRESRLMGYSLTDAMLALGDEEIPAVREAMDAVPEHDRGAFDLCDRLAESEDEEWLRRLFAENFLLRLTWKQPTPAREGTNWGALPKTLGMSESEFFGD